MGKTDVTSVKVCHDQEIALATRRNPEQRLNSPGKLGDCTVGSLSRNVRHPLRNCNVRYQAFFIKM